MGEKPKTSFNVVQEFIVRPKPGTRFGPNCIAIGTRVPVEKDGQVLVIILRVVFVVLISLGLLDMMKVSYLFGVKIS